MPLHTLDSLFVLQSIVRMVAPQIHNVDIEDMAPDSGATVQKGFRKVAVYKDPEGKKHAFSALCPHLGCLLQVKRLTNHAVTYVISLLPPLVDMHACPKGYFCTFSKHGCVFWGRNQNHVLARLLQP